jgi:hypothetical protein
MNINKTTEINLPKCYDRYVEVRDPKNGTLNFDNALLTSTFALPFLAPNFDSHRNYLKEWVKN